MAEASGASRDPEQVTMSARERLRIPRHPMSERDPASRVRDWDEVLLGYDFEEAREEADRCILCRQPPCIDGCPVGINIVEVLRAVQGGDLEDAYEILTDASALPAICGRVCAQEVACEKVCVLSRKGDPVAIGNLERYVADWAHERGLDAPGKPVGSSGLKVAIVGSGPAGITAAGDLARLGHSVTIFEALHRPGGVLVYGIPDFRLPNPVVAQELSALDSLGVEIVTNAVVGHLIQIDDLRRDFDAVFVATGAGLPNFLGIEGESLNGVFSGNEFLMRINLMRADRFPEYDTPISIGKTLVVVGGGDTSMDCCRIALRMGAEKVILLYRRSRELMPSRAEEVDHALAEGVELRTYTAPLRFIGEGGWVTGVECTELTLGEPDESGRARPVPKKGTEYVLPCDSVVLAIGFSVNPTVTRSEPRLTTDKWGVIEADEDGATSMPGVFAGGDVVTGGATVVLAMAQGRRAARAIDSYLRLGAVPSPEASAVPLGG